MTDPQATLLPCPLCQGRYRPEIRDGDRNGKPGVFIWCSECGIRSDLFTYDPVITSGKKLAVEAAVNRWNTRAQPKTPDHPAIVEAVARAINPEAWAVMDSYRRQTERKYAGQNVGWPEDQFKHKPSMKRAQAALSAALPLIRAEIAEQVVRDVAELPDRSSPDDWPEAMLVTGDELRSLIMGAE